MKHFLSTIAGAIVSVSALAQSTQQLAFPDAQGWGRYATGGRGGSVYHVTNLNDSGSGSLRDAVSRPNRIVVFDVAGVINISSRMTFANNLYIAGQTAPGEGITVYGDGVSFSGANNIICRYLRVRMGHGGSSGKDCAGVANGTNMIFDHCSFVWGLDETFSINSDGKGTLGDITIMNCVVGQGLMPHSAGGLIQADHITLLRNLYCDNSTRNNKVKGTNQYANNIVYNWQNGAYIMGGDSEGQSQCNIVGNLFINGPSGGGAAFTGGNGNFHFYGADNWQDRDANGVFAPTAVTDYSASDKRSTPYDYPTLTVTSGKDLIAELLPTVGASLPYRDMTDCYMIDEVMSYGKRGELIANEGTLPYGVPSTWTVYKGVKRADADHDGMPDWWEEANGTDPKKDDAMAIAANGYANIENYINSITAEHRDAFLRKPMMLSLAAATTTTLTMQWADYTEGETCFVVEAKQADGSWAEVARTAANATQQRLTGLLPGTEYTLRVRAMGKNGEADVWSDYSDVVSVKTRPQEVGIIDIDTFSPHYTWTPAVTTWNNATADWAEQKPWVNDGTQSVLFNNANDASVAIAEQVNPSAIVVSGEGNLTFSGEGGVVGDATSVNKTGEGTLTLGTLNAYKGATVLHEGVIEFNTLKDGGQPSAIGASQEFAQNWIMDGGTYRYTGASTTTNRSARLLRPTVLDIANKSAVVKMNGTIEGDSDFILDGQGQMQIAGTNFFGYSGRTILRGGELLLSTLAATKAQIGKSSGVTMAGGKLSTKGDNEAEETYSFDMYVQPGTYSVFAPHRRCYMAGKLTGSGTLELLIPYVREYVKGDWTAFTGRIVARAAADGNLLLANSSFNLPHAVVELKNGARAVNWATDGNATLGGLSGGSGTYLCGSSKQTNGFKCSWHIGSANTDETFAGIINDWSASGSGHTGTVSIEKTGSGYWRLSGANSYSGTTTVSDGRLIVNGVHTGKGAVTVANGATLAGQGTLAAAVTVKKGGAIFAGDSLIAAKVLTLSTATLQAGSKMITPVKGGVIMSTNRVKASKLTIASDVTLELDLTNMNGASFANDKYITIFSSGTVVSGQFAHIVPEQPSPSQRWDTSQLYTKGLLYIRSNGEETAIDGIENGTPQSGDEFVSLNGTIVTSPQSGHIYIKNGKKVLNK